MTPITHQASEEAAFKKPTPPPAFWPSDLVEDFKTASEIRDMIDPDKNDLDIYIADSVIEYGLRLQSISGNGAELMARMRMAVEQARGDAIVRAMSDEKVDFSSMSATLQNKYVDSKIAVHHAAYTYCEFLNKRISYAMDYVRSLLSYIKADMQNNTPMRQS